MARACDREEKEEEDYTRCWHPTRLNKWKRISSPARRWNHEARSRCRLRLRCDWEGCCSVVVRSNTSRRTMCINDMYHRRIWTCTTQGSLQGARCYETRQAVVPQKLREAHAQIFLWHLRHLPLLTAYPLPMAGPHACGWLMLLGVQQQQHGKQPILCSNS